MQGLDFESHPETPFLWLRLPDPWMSGTFRAAALNEGVLIDDEDEFKPGRSDKVWHRVRIGPFATQREATTYRAQFENRERMPTIVVRRDALQYR